MHLPCTVFELYIASYLSKVANLNLSHLHLAYITPIGGNSIRLTPRSLASEN